MAYNATNWKDRWQNNDTPWVGENVNNVLVESLPKLKSTYDLKPGERVLVPLAGDSPAVRILFDEGFDVTAVEYVPEAARRLVGLFPEGLSARIQILVQDFLSFSAPGQFGFVYDRAAYVALSPEQRPQYAQIVADALRPGGLLLSRTTEIIGGEWQGPPFSAPFEEVRYAFPALTLLEHNFSAPLPVPERFLVTGVQELRHVNCIFRKS